MFSVPAFPLPQLLDLRSLFATGVNGFLYDSLTPQYAFTDAGTTAVAADGDLVQQINDRSGNGNNASQPTSSTRGAFTFGKAGSILFDNVDDYMDTALVPAASLTLAVLWRGNVSSAKSLIGSRTTANDKIRLGTNSGGRLQADAGTSTAVAASAAQSPANKWVAGLLRVNASVLELWINGEISGASPMAGSINTTRTMFLSGDNNNGTPASFGASSTTRIARAFAIQKFLEIDRIKPLMRTLSVGVPMLQ